VNRELLRRLRAELWQAPRAHGEVLLERSVSPLELFYDLVVVVLVAQAAHHLAQDLTPTGLGQFATVFAIVWIAWFNGTLHHELHGREDVRARNTFLGQILLLVPLGAFIPEVGRAHGQAFAVDSALLFGFLALLWWRAGRDDTADFTTTTRVYVWATLVVAIVLACSVALPASARLAAWAILAALYLLAVVAVFAAAPPAVAASLTITDALTERFGAFVIIVLGETVTGVVAGLAPDPTRPISLAVGLTAIVVGFGSWWTYFDFVGNRQPRETRPAALFWMLGHLPITAAIAAMGAAMVTLVQHPAAVRTGAAVAWILSGGAIVILVVIAVQLTCLQAWHRDRSLYRPLSVVCLLMCVLPVVIGLLQPNPLLLGASLVVAFGVPWTFAVIRRAQLAA
jgi:low temperature requirement protein LtrA